MSPIAPFTTSRRASAAAGEQTRPKARNRRGKRARATPVVDARDKAPRCRRFGRPAWRDTPLADDATVNTGIRYVLQLIALKVRPCGAECLLDALHARVVPVLTFLGLEAQEREGGIVG